MTDDATTPGALNHLLQPLPPERSAPPPHLGDLNPDQLLQRRVEITAQLKILEGEHQATEAELVEVFSDAELRFGVRAPRSWVLRQENRTSWDDDLEIGDAIKGLQQQAQRDGRAQPLVSTYLVATQEDHRHAAKIQKNQVGCNKL
jgi:hypothetical protein